MPIPSLPPSPAQNDLFSLAVSHYKAYTKIDMVLFTKAVNTRDLPHTSGILTQILPTVLESECFNELHLPFHQEANATEIGHLFEHILLEYLCLQKMTLGCKSATYSGVTNWNWKKDSWGTFHITISAGYKDYLIFSRALEKSIALLNIVLAEHSQNHYPTALPTLDLPAAY